MDERFRIEEEAGRGGMAIVYRAFDRVTAQRVALKVLHKSDDSAVRRFANEAESLAKLDHPNIVRYLAHGVPEEGPYLVLEWVEGESLEAHLTARGAHLAIADVLALGQKLASALEAAHAAGIVHRDLKPSNVLLVGGDLAMPKLVDFGVVRARRDVPTTTAGAVLGTVGYMAPEQARGEPDLDGRADLFSLGCLLFRCLTHREVFEGRDPVTRLSQLLLDEPRRASEIRTDTPPELDELIAQLLAKDPKARPASAADVRRALEHIHDGWLDATQTSQRTPVLVHEMSSVPSSRPSVRKWWPLVAAMAAALATVGAAIGISWRRPAAKAPSAMAPPAGTSVLDLPLPSCTAGAVAAYREGLSALREGRWSRAQRFFEQAVREDPACPQAKLRRFLGGEGWASAGMQRENMREALRLRDGLSERDRLLLDVTANDVLQEIPRLQEGNERLEEAVARFPLDAEMLLSSAYRKLRLDDPAGLETALARTRKVIEIDPHYADAWQLQAMALDRLGRTDEALATLAKCLELFPDAFDCRRVRVALLSRIGKCAEAAEDAKRWMARQPEGCEAPYHLAVALSADEAPRARVEEALRSHWPETPPDVQLRERGKLEAWFGDFESALHTAHEIERNLANSARVEWRWAAALLAVETLTEQGDTATAGRIAEQALRRKGAWTRDYWTASDGAFLEAWLLGAALRGGQLTPTQWRGVTDAWERAYQGNLDDVVRWRFRWGPAIGPELPAAEALARMPKTGAPSAAYLGPEMRVGVGDAYAGYIHLAHGNAAAAAPLLEAAASACTGFRQPFVAVRAHLWLGMAKEQLGDTAAACGAYRFVVDRWGNAKPASVTARDAEKRRRALDCKD